MASGVVMNDIDKFISALPKETEQPSSAGSYPGKHVIPRKLLAFEKLTQHAMNRFSVDRLYEFLRVVLQELKLQAKSDESAPDGSGTTQKALTLKSFEQVSEIMEEMKVKETKQKLTDRQSVALKFYSTFMNDYEYLEQAEKYFYNNIYWCLLEDFYDPNTGTTQSNSEKSSEASRGPKGQDKKKTEKSNGKRVIESPGENDKKRLHHVVSQMKDTLSKWEGILKKGDLNGEQFDPDSYHEIVHFANFSSFELMLRAIPDIFVKCYKCIDLAREWLKLAERVYRGKLPLGRRIKRPGSEHVERGSVNERQASDVLENNSQVKQPSVTSKDISKEEKRNSPQMTSTQITSPQTALLEYQTKVKELRGKLAEIDKDIRKKEKEIQVLNKDMVSLNARENRVNQLTGTYNEMDGKIQSASDELAKVLQDQHLISAETKEKTELEIVKREKEIGLLKFQKSVIQEDYLLELEIRPNFIHISGDIQSKISILKAGIEAKNAEKCHLEQEINDMVTDGDQMRERLSEYLGREVTQSDMDLAKDLFAAEIVAPQENGFDSIGGNRVESDQSFVSESEVDLADYLNPTHTERKIDSRSAKPPVKSSPLPPPKVVGHYHSGTSASKPRRTTSVSSQNAHKHSHGRNLSSRNRVS